MYKHFLFFALLADDLDSVDYIFDSLDINFELKKNKKGFIWPTDYKNLIKVVVGEKTVFYLKSPSDVVAIFNATVIYVSNKCVVMRGKFHNEVITIKYDNINAINLKKNQKIKKGDKLGTVNKVFEVSMFTDKELINVFDLLPYKNVKVQVAENLSR